VLAESFGHSVFRDSLKRVCQSGENDLGLSSCGIFEINCSKDIKVQGIIGPCASLEKVSYKTVKGIYFSFAYCDQYLMIICRKDRCALTLPSVRDTQAHGRCVASTTTLPYVWFLKLLK
jgi:hypothetical protein